MSRNDPSVIERERAFHNARFAHDETREHQGKYYFAIRDCDDEYERLLVEHGRDAVALDYGCARGEYGLNLAPIAKEVHGIDISDVAIDTARADAAARGLSNAHFEVMDAHATTFPDNHFDFVFGIGIIHHLDTRRSFAEIARILKPGGVAIFREPLAGNLLIDLYRKATPAARTVDEHPLTAADHKIAAEYFPRNDWRFYGLATLGAVPFRNTPAATPIFNLAAAVDRALFTIPPMRWQAWNALMKLGK